MYAFPARQPPPDILQNLVLRCRLLRHFICQQSAAWLRNDTAHFSHQNPFCSALSLRRLISVFQTTSWLIIFYLDSRCRRPNAVLQQPFLLARLAPSSVWFSHAVRFSSSLQRTECAIHQITPPVYYACGAASCEVLFSHLDTLSSRLTSSSRFKFCRQNWDFVYSFIPPPFSVSKPLIHAVFRHV